MPQKTKKQKIQSKQRRMNLGQQDTADNHIHNTSFESLSHQPIASSLMFSFRRHGSNRQEKNNEDILFPAEREIAKTLILSVVAIAAVVILSFTI